MYPATRCPRDGGWRLDNRTETGSSTAAVGRTTVAAGETLLRISGKTTILLEVIGLHRLMQALAIPLTLLIAKRRYFVLAGLIKG